MDKCCEATDGQMLRGYRWTNIARVQMDNCCENTDGLMLRRYRWTNVARIQMDKCCEDDGTYVRCKNCTGYIAGIILYIFEG